MQPGIPWYVSPIITLVSISVAFWLYRLIARATRSAGLPAPTGALVRWSAGLFLAGWLVLAFLLAGSSPALDGAGRSLVPGTFRVFGGISLAVAIGLLVFSPTWRRVVDAIPADSLISVQVYRLIGGFLFLPLYAIGILPGYFALPAGWGDAAVGLLAPLVALAVRRQLRRSRALALGWNLFGFADLIVAVGLGTGYLLLLLSPQSGPVSPAAAMTFFPLVMIPTFAVPLGFILHIYSIRRTLRRKQAREVGRRSVTPAGRQLYSGEG